MSIIRVDEVEGGVLVLVITQCPKCKQEHSHLLVKESFNNWQGG